MSVIEIVSWNAKRDVSDEEMCQALAAMVPDLKSLPGFQYQLAGKDSNGRWVDVYYWDSAKDAHASNDLMADKESLAVLLALVELESVCIEVIEPQQVSSDTIILNKSAG